MILWLGFSIVGFSTSSVHLLALAASYGPLVVSLATLILPLGGWWWQQQEGGRSPSARERLLYEDALTTLRAADPDLRAPKRWFVLDTPAINGAVYADTMMLTRGLLESEWVAPVIAHELGHLHSTDGRLAAAISRLTSPPRNALVQPYGLIQRAVRLVIFAATGELALWVTKAPWGIYWRAREFEADRYAANLGQAEQLAADLEANALQWDIPIPFVWMTEHTHPPSEHRIDRLYQYEPPMDTERASENEHERKENR
jgi:Zn-dependent protease with chaperone function